MAQKPKSTSRSRHGKDSKKPVTIDLDAKDVKKADSAAKATATKATSVKAKPSVPTAGTKSDGRGSKEAASKSESLKAKAGPVEADAAKAVSARADAGSDDGQRASGANTDKAQPQPSEKSRKSAPDSALQGSMKSQNGPVFGSALLAACIGGVVALGLAGLLQYAGILGVPGGLSADSEAGAQLESRVASLEDKLASQPALAGEQVAALIDERLAAVSNSSADRVSAIESAIKKIQEQSAGPAGVSSPDTSLVARLDELASDVAALKSAPLSNGGTGGNSASVDQLDKLSEEIENVFNEQAAKIDSLRKELDEARARQTSVGSQLADAVQKLSVADAKQAGFDADIAALRDRLENGADQRAATAIAAAALKGDIDSGKPFASSLNNLMAFAPGRDDLQSLESFAETGVPTVAQLTAQFEGTVSAAILDAAVPKKAGGIAERLAAGARALVEVKPIGVIEGDSPAARVSQILGALKSNDLSEAASVWEQLPETGRVASRDWHERLQARLTANTVVSGAVENILKSSRGE